MLARWLEVKDDLYAGRKPRVTGDGLTVRELANRILTVKKTLVDSGEYSPQTWRDLHRTCERLIKRFGRTRLVSDLAADDFEPLRADLAAAWAPNTVKTEIQRIRTICNYGYQAGLIDRPVRFGPMFKAPSRRVIEKARRANGDRMFEPAEIHRLLDAASVPMKAMILLGINGGLGNNDVGKLSRSALDLESGWLDYPRPKTGIPRRIPLWPETVAAIRAAIAERPQPKDPADDGLIFITTRGNAWTRHDEKGWRDSVTNNFGLLLRSLGLKRPGRNFYCLRHCFETVAGDSVDQVAVDAIMGHRRGDMASVYRERISDERLVAVVEHVRGWLFGDCQKGGS